MSDVRMCDGPQCTVARPLDETEGLQFGSGPRAENFITLDRKHGRASMHFHNDSCLVAWTRENNKK